MDVFKNFFIYHFLRNILPFLGIIFLETAPLFRSSPIIQSAHDLYLNIPASDIR